MVNILNTTKYNVAKCVQTNILTKCTQVTLIRKLTVPAMKSIRVCSYLSNETISHHVQTIFSQTISTRFFQIYIHTKAISSNVQVNMLWKTF